MVYEEGIFQVKVINWLSIPHSNKIISAQKPQIVLEKTRMYCSNCHKTNHNVETSRIKRKEDLVPVIYEVTTQQIKV